MFLAAIEAAYGDQSLFDAEVCLDVYLFWKRRYGYEYRALSLYIYICIHIYICMHVYIYIYIPVALRRRGLPRCVDLERDGDIHMEIWIYIYRCISINSIFAFVLRIRRSLLAQSKCRVRPTILAI